tara:strand:- start:149 stop:526 length:378 start_codon:yes stop_codon:yes gene_type:complete
MEGCCEICGDLLDSQYVHKLSCGHKYHYQCIFLTYKHTKNIQCPYKCKMKEKLPLVNGIKKVVPWIHEVDEANVYENKKCETLLTRGKNKGMSCSRYCELGYFNCKIHNKSLKKNTNNNGKPENI